MADKYAFGFDSPESIKRAANQLVEHLRKELDRNTDWTGANFNALDSFVPENKILKRYHKRNHSEFLWDYVASDDRQGLYLVAESEKATGTKNYESFPLKNDFEKLLYAFAPLRLMICHAKDEDDAQRIAEELSSYSKTCCLNFSSAAAFVLYCRISEHDVAWVWQASGYPQPMSAGGIDFNDSETAEDRMNNFVLTPGETE